MRDFLILFVHLIVTLARLARPGGLRSVVAESALVRHQLLVLNRGRKRAPNLLAADRIIAGLCTLSSPGTRSPFRHRSEAFHSGTAAQSAKGASLRALCRPLGLRSPQPIHCSRASERPSPTKVIFC